MRVQCEAEHPLRRILGAVAPSRGCSRRWRMVLRRESRSHYAPEDTERRRGASKERKEAGNDG